jgi:hypothetical protein
MKDFNNEVVKVVKRQDKCMTRSWNSKDPEDFIVIVRLTTRPVLECTVRVAEENSNRTIECPVLARLIDQVVFLIIKYTNRCS